MLNDCVEQLACLKLCDDDVLGYALAPRAARVRRGVRTEVVPTSVGSAAGCGSQARWITRDVPSTPVVRLLSNFNHSSDHNARRGRHH
jgi:hypothetical protein